MALVRRLTLLALLLSCCSWQTGPGDGTSRFELHLGSYQGAAYRIEVPEQWNRTLLLYSHGYVAAGLRARAADAPSTQVAGWLLDHGYALAGSAYRNEGWAVQDALRDQEALVDLFSRRYGAPRRVIAWGSSMGGLVTAALVEDSPHRFAGALAMCGGVAGGVAEWNQRLDAEYALRTLLAPTSALRLTGIVDPAANTRLALQVATDAQVSAAGRARLALASAIGGIPGWTGGAPSGPPTAAAVELGQFHYWSNAGARFFFGYRSDLEQRAGGNPSWNTGVDYAAVLEQSGMEDQVRDLYAAAGLNLSADLARLAAGPRVAADPAAVEYLQRYAAPAGAITVPVLTMHGVADGQVPVAQEEAYAAAVARHGRSALLRQVFVQRGGHCGFSPGEQLAAMTALTARVGSGRWPGWLDARGLQAHAAALWSGSERFVAYRPPPFPRPFVPGVPAEPTV